MELLAERIEDRAFAAALSNKRMQLTKRGSLV